MTEPLNHHTHCTLFVCPNCGKQLKKGEKEMMEKYLQSECAECTFHACNGTHTIAEYNEWLRKA